MYFNESDKWGSCISVSTTITPKLSYKLNFSQNPAELTSAANEDRILFLIPPIE
jgi:hypothetical protein